VRIWKAVSGNDESKPTLHAKFNYYGGHKKYPIQGMMAKADGKAELYYDEIIFEKDAYTKKNRWVMKISLKSIQLDNFGINDKVTGQFFDGVSFFGFDFGGSTKNRTEPRLIIPFVDEDNILQTPEFTFQNDGFMVTDDTGKWAKEIYNTIISLNKSSPQRLTDDKISEISNHVELKFKENVEKTSKPKEQDPLNILKLRLSKGEITLEEFEKLKKAIE